MSDHRCLNAEQITKTAANLAEFFKILSVNWVEASKHHGLGGPKSREGSHGSVRGRVEVDRGRAEVKRGRAEVGSNSYFRVKGKA